MASAILARRNEPYWAEAKVYMRKSHPNSHANPNKQPKLGSNPNPNPSPKLAGGHDSSDRPRQFPAPEYDDPQPSTAAAVSDDSSSFNRKSAGPPDHRRGSGGYVTIKISAYTKKELRELKRRLESELEQVRSVVSRIESREIQSSARSVGHSVSGVYGGGGGGGREVTSSATGLEGFRDRPALWKDNKGFSTGRPVVSPNRAKRLAAAPGLERLLASTMSKCRQILSKLMKQKGSNWFNIPVDVKGMNLHDYNQIVKHPMDLGTVRTNLTKGLYSSPQEFAEDVRLTFNNALLYNPKGHIVNELAGRLLRYFDGEFRPAYERHQKQQAAIATVIAREEDERLRSAAWSRPQVLDIATRADPVPVISPPRPAMVQAVAPDPIPVPVPTPALAMHQRPPPQQPQHVVVDRPMIGRLPKPKARDLNKRPMNMEEKGRLSEGLQSLPQDKMEQVVQIVKKRNGDLEQDGDEIELDFEAMDTETLWELDRFVGNCKKMMSKIRRQEAISTSTAPPSLSIPAEADDQSPKRFKKGGDAGDEDVIDIGDEMPSGNYPSVEIEKDNASSSGSDSSSTSSSGSDSDSSSGSDSDDARSPAPAPAPAAGLGTSP